MLDRTSLPIICTTNPSHCSKWFVHLKTLATHPSLKEEEKLLWLWLATKSATNPTFCCSLSYEQIALAMNKSEKMVHRSLFRLKLMGFLKSDIPIWYGKPTKEMAKKVRLMKLLMPVNNAHIPWQITEYEKGCMPLSPMLSTSNNEALIFKSELSSYEQRNLP